MLEKSSLETLYSSQLTLSSQLIKSDYLNFLVLVCLLLNYLVVVTCISFTQSYRMALMFLFKVPMVATNQMC